MRSIALAFLLIASAGCAARSPVAAPTETHVLAPLEARLLNSYGSSELAFQLSRPAHVAVFEVIPGSGASLIYPSRAYQSRHFPEGFSMVHTWQDRWSRIHYRPRLGPPSIRYLYMIASEAPLELDVIQREPYKLRRLIGYEQFASPDPYRVMAAIDAAVVPYAVAGNVEYVTDVFLDWEPFGSRSGTFAFIGHYGGVLSSCHVSRFAWYPFGFLRNSGYWCDVPFQYNYSRYTTARMGEGGSEQAGDGLRFRPWISEPRSRSPALTELPGARERATELGQLREKERADAQERAGARQPERTGARQPRASGRQPARQPSTRPQRETPAQTAPETRPAPTPSSAPKEERTPLTDA